ncbi:MAG: hypothetical protein Q7Q71_08465 [Verrucomicrobiota bacterium JB023]|nr:hypothetical protein [Verrucomicrobiota bacterium JB023]
MEFKVIFIGFALHCVLNVVLIGKSMLSKRVDSDVAEAQVQQVQASERAMLQSLTSGEEMRSLQSTLEAR